MVRVKLKGRTGELAAEVLVPPFILWPEIFIWGQRLFAREKPFERCETVEPPEYREAFGAACLTEDELKQIGRM